jgi:uncharacterized spore protein YtfJ
MRAETYKVEVSRRVTCFERKDSNVNNETFNDAAEQAARPGPFEKIVDGVVEKVLSTTGAQTVFGDPVREEHRTVIPVARVTYRFGFGAGTGPAEDPGSPPPGGGGGGGNLVARPVGYIETTADGSRFVPVIDWSQVLTTTLAFAGVGTLVLIWRAGMGRSRRQHMPPLIPGQRFRQLPGRRRR